jgi:hypothetical protein
MINRQPDETDEEIEEIAEAPMLMRGDSSIAVANTVVVTNSSQMSHSASPLEIKNIW